MEVKPIGTIHSPFRDASGVPIQPAFANEVEGTVGVLAEYAEALADLDGFERIWLLYWFDRAAPFQARVRPYLDNESHGLFATRAPVRPNPIGLSCVKLLSVKGTTLRIGGVDVLDGTPLLDIKPYTNRFDRFEVARNGWLDTVERGSIQSDERFFGTLEQGTTE